MRVSVVCHSSCKKGDVYTDICLFLQKKSGNDKPETNKIGFLQGRGSKWGRKISTNGDKTLGSKEEQHFFV